VQARRKGWRVIGWDCVYELVPPKVKKCEENVRRTEARRNECFVTVVSDADGCRRLHNSQRADSKRPCEAKARQERARHRRRRTMVALTTESGHGHTHHTHNQDRAAEQESSDNNQTRKKRTRQEQQPTKHTKTWEHKLEHSEDDTTRQDLATCDKERVGIARVKIFFTIVSSPHGGGELVQASQKRAREHHACVPAKTG
jgi:hypothetical protein